MPPLVPILALALISLAHAASAQTVQAEALARVLLRPVPPSRGLTAPPAAPQMDDGARSFLRALPVSRSLAEEDRAALVTITETYELPSVDVDIHFDYNVATPRAESLPDIVQIGIALTSDALAGQRFVLAGHTDGTGGAAYNLELSQRRAEAVRDVLIRSFSIAPERLIAVGFGFEQLQNVADPAAAENRRVEIINLEVAWN